MISKLKSHPAFKDSGVEWLGKGDGALAYYMPKETPCSQSLRYWVV